MVQIRIIAQINERVRIRGVKVKSARLANKIGIKHLTVYAFSTENWNRTKEEVGALMLLLGNYLDDFSKRADTENVKIQI